MICLYAMDETKTTNIGALLLDEHKVKFENFLKENVDVFA